MKGKPDDVLYEGVMWKRGRRKEWFSIIKPWAERTIKLLRCGKIQYFDNDRMRGELNILGARVVEKSPEEAEGRNFAFEIICVDDNEGSLLMSAKTRSEMNCWIKCVMLVATDSWEKAKEAESTASARAMPFPVRIRSTEFQDRTSTWALANQTVSGRLSTVGLSPEEEDIFMRQCDLNCELWKDTLAPEVRAVITSLRLHIECSEMGISDDSTGYNDIKSPQLPPKGLVRKETEANIWFSNMSKKSVSKQQSIKQFIGIMPAESEKHENYNSVDSNVSDLTPSTPERDRVLSARTDGELSPVSNQPPIRRGSLAGVKAVLGINRSQGIESRELISYEPWLVIGPKEWTKVPMPLDVSPRSRLFQAVEDGNVSYITQMQMTHLSPGSSEASSLTAQFNEMEYGIPLLHKTMSYGRSECLQLMLSHNIDTRPHLRGSLDATEQSLHPQLLGWTAGETALHAACTPIPAHVDAQTVHRRTQGQLECLSILIKHLQGNRTSMPSTPQNDAIKTSDLNYQTPFERWSPLHKAAWLGLEGHVRLLLSFRNLSHKNVSTDEESKPITNIDYVNVDLRDTYGFTALHLACAAGHVACVAALLEAGADLTLEGGECLNAAKNGNLFTAVHLAAFKGHANVLEYLCKLDPAVAGFATKESYRTFLIKRHSKGLFEGGVDYFSALSGSVKCLQTCLDHGMLTGLTTPGGSSDSNGNPPNEGAAPIHYAARHCHEQAVLFLIKNGANLSRKGFMRRTPILEAAQGGNIVIIDMLVSSGGLLSDKDSRGNTALHVAAAANNLKAVQMLTERYGLVDTIRNAEGKTALDVALTHDHGDIVRYLRSCLSQSNHNQEDFIPREEVSRRGSYKPPMAYYASNVIGDGSAKLPSTLPAAIAVSESPTALSVSASLFTGDSNSPRVVQVVQTQDTSSSETDA